MKSTVFWPLLPLFIPKWLPIAEIHWHILFVLIKTNILKKKFFTIELKIKKLRFWVMPLFHPLYFGNGKSYVKSVRTLPKALLKRNPTKKIPFKLDEKQKIYSLYKKYRFWPLLPLFISKWLPKAEIHWHILFVLFKTNILKNKFVKIGL